MNLKFTLILLMLFTLINAQSQDITYPKRITLVAQIDTVLYSPCHYSTLYLRFKIKDSNLSFTDSMFMSQGLRGYQFSSSYLNKLYPNSTLEQDHFDHKAEVLLGLYYDSINSAPVLEWISEKSRENSFTQLRELLIREGVYKISDKLPTIEQTANKLIILPCLQTYFTPNLIYEVAGRLNFIKNGENMIAIENPIGSGNWTSERQK